MSSALIAKLQSGLKKNQSENEVQNDSQNEENGGQNDQNSENTHSENDSQNGVKTDESIQENKARLFDGDGDGSDPDEVEVKVSKKDPLDGFIQEPEPEPEPQPTTVGETVKQATGDSAKNNKNLADMGEMLLDMVDIWKAQMCSAISGQHPAEYTGDQKAKKILIEAFKEYLSSKEISTPSPFVTLLLALAMWGGPAFGAAYWHRIQIKRKEQVQHSEVEITYIRDMPNQTPKAESKSDVQDVEDEEEEEKKDYSHLKEVRENRRSFEIHKTNGTYNTLPNGTFCKIAVADEKPSPEILFLIKAGKTNQEIREIIGNE